MKRFFLLAALASLLTVAVEPLASAWGWGRAKFIIFRDGEVRTRVPNPPPITSDEPGPYSVSWKDSGWAFSLRSSDGDEFVLDCYGPGGARTQVASRCSLHKSEKTELFLFVSTGYTVKNLHIWCE